MKVTAERSITGLSALKSIPAQKRSTVLEFRFTPPFTTIASCKHHGEVVSAVRDLVRRHMPAGYRETMNWGMITWELPLARYPDTYNGQPLCYVGLGAHKTYNSLYLMGTYGSSDGKYTSPFSEKLLVDAFKKAGKRLDMGKCCLHFKELDDLELTSVATVIAMSTPKEYIAYYRRVKGLA